VARLRALTAEPEGAGRSPNAAARPVRVGTRLDWSSGEPAPIVEAAHELAGAGAETIAISFGDEREALDRMTRFYALFMAA
jgi:hypothetical protein